MKKYIIFIGNYGSGKTELAINLALEAAKRGRTEIIDLDMVNTYFRLSDKKKLFEASEIRLISPNYAGANIETLSLPPEVSSAFHMDWDTVIFDAGGDPAGATALGRYHEEFSALEPGQLEVLNVVNLRRPMSGTAERIVSLAREMEDASRLRVTGFVNNTNLSVETTPAELRDGYFALREVSRQTGIPVKFTSGRRELLNAFLAEGHDPRFIGEPMEITTRLNRDWGSFVNAG